MTKDTEALREAEALRAALKNLLDACYQADNRENLSEEIDGSLLDEAAAALELQYPVIWTDDQVAMLRMRQADCSMHPYTCGGDRADPAHIFHAEEEGEEPGLLYPTVRGWKCPACDYRQFWSHETGGPALATPASAELGFDPTAEVGDEVFPHDERNDSYKYKVRIVPGPPDLPEAPATSRKIVDGVDLGPVSQPYPGADDLILAPCSCGFCGNPTPVDPVAGGEALREALEWYRDQLCEGFCEGFTPRICKAAMEENPTGGDCSGCRAVIALAALKGPAA